MFKFGLELETQSKNAGTKAPQLQAHVRVQILLPLPTNLQALKLCDVKSLRILAGQFWSES